MKKSIEMNKNWFLLLKYRNRLYAGVARDVQRQQQRKIENTYVLQQQIELTKHLKNLEQKELEASELKDTSA